jgi:succinylglutamate desuccinylase
LEASGIEAVLLSHQSTTTLSYFSSEQHNASAFTVELGQVAPFGENDHSKLTAIRHTLRYLIKDEELTSSDQGSMKIFQVIDGLNKDAEDYQLNIATDFENFTSFDAGFKLTQSQLSEYLVRQDGDALVFPNTKIPVGQRAGLMVREVALSSLELN